MWALEKWGMGSLLLALLFGLAWMATEKLQRTPPDGTDQVEWTAISILHLRQLEGKPPPGIKRDEIRGDLHPDPWRQGVQATTFGWPNPSLHKIAWGLVCSSRAPKRIFPNTFLRYHEGNPKRMERAYAPLMGAVERAQQVVALASAACAVMLFLLGRALAGWAGGLAAYSLWLVHPVVRTWSHQARPDFGMLFLFLLVPVLTLALAPQLSGRRGIVRQVASWCAVGLVAGLCVATKLNGGLAGVFLASCVPLFAWLPERDQPRPRSLPLLCSALCGGLVLGAVLFALFPYLWSAPLDHLREVREFWAEHMLGHQDRWQSLGGTVTRTLGEKAALVFSRMFGRDEPIFACTGIPGGFALLGAGFGWLGLRALGKGPGSGAAVDRGPARIAMLWIAVSVLGTMLWLPLEWERYFFPSIAVAVLAEGVLVGLLFERLWPDRLRRAIGGKRESRLG